MAVCARYGLGRVYVSVGRRDSDRRPWEHRRDGRTSPPRSHRQSTLAASGEAPGCSLRRPGSSGTSPRREHARAVDRRARPQVQATAAYAKAGSPPLTSLDRRPVARSTAGSTRSQTDHRPTEIGRRRSPRRSRWTTTPKDRRAASLYGPDPSAASAKLVRRACLRLTLSALRLSRRHGSRPGRRAHHRDSIRGRACFARRDG